MDSVGDAYPCRVCEVPPEPRHQPLRMGHNGEEGEEHGQGEEPDCRTAATSGWPTIRR